MVIFYKLFFISLSLQELNNGNIKHACLGLSCLHKFENILIAPAAQELTGKVMVNQGLVQKIGILTFANTSIYVQ